MAANVASGLFNGSLAAIGLALAAVVVAAGALVASLSLRRRLRRMRPESVRANGKPWAGSRRWREFVGAMTAALADAHRIAVAAGRGERPIGWLRRFVAIAAGEFDVEKIAATRTEWAPSSGRSSVTPG